LFFLPACRIAAVPPRLRGWPLAIACCLALAPVLHASCQRKSERRSEPVGFRLTVLDTGGEPRRALRYGSDPPAEQRMALALRVAMEMEASGSPVPPITLPGLRLLFDVTGKKQGELSRYELTVTNADLTGADAAHPPIVTEMREGLSSLIGATGVVAIDERGLERERSLGLPEGLSGELAQFMRSTELALGELALPLPDEPVGVGAKWQVEQTITVDGVHVQQKTHYELLAADGPRLQLRSQIVQSAEAQEASLPGLPSRVSAEMLSLRGAGSGQVEVDLRRLVPTSASAEVEASISFAIQQGQSQRVMSLTSTSGLDVQSL
jgi:hypothetical protein